MARQGGDTRDELFADVVRNVDEMLVTTSAIADVSGLTRALTGSSTSVRLLLGAAVLAELRREFFVASQLKDHVESGIVDVRITGDEAYPTLLITDDVVRCITGLSSDSIAVLSRTDDEFASESRAVFEDRWEDAETLSIRAPARSQLLGTLDDEFGSAVRTDFESALETIGAIDSDGDSTDPVQLCLLIGAKHEIQFYELGRWGETTDVASRAKFSQEKQALEKAGLITTEKVPREVGRPRQRLVLHDGRGNQNADELIREAHAALAE
jgi:hypothetical protein